MQISPYDPGHEVAWSPEHPRWSPSRKRCLRLVVVAGGALAITVVTILIVAGFQILRSDDAKLLTQAAKDKTRAIALSAAKTAECDRLMSEARAAAQQMPPCADKHANKASTTDAAIAAGVEVAKSELLAAAAD
jgi:hypothetical protein